jgi:hypothetical protein
VNHAHGDCCGKYWTVTTECVKNSMTAKNVGGRTFVRVGRGACLTGNL